MKRERERERDNTGALAGTAQRFMQRLIGSKITRYNKQHTHTVYTHNTGKQIEFVHSFLLPN